MNTHKTTSKQFALAINSSLEKYLRLEIEDESKVQREVKRFGITGRTIRKYRQGRTEATKRVHKATHFIKQNQEVSKNDS